MTGQTADLKRGKIAEQSTGGGRLNFPLFLMKKNGRRRYAMKIFGFLIAVLFVFGVNVASVHANTLKGSSSSAYQRLDGEKNVLVTAKATPGGQETETYKKKAQETID